MTHETIYVIFRCPNGHQGMEICAFSRFKCKECNNVFSPNQAEIELINGEAAKELQESGVNLFMLISAYLSFDNDVVIQNSNKGVTGFYAEIANTGTEKKRVILVSKDKKQQVKVFEGSKFSEEDFKKNMGGLTSILEPQS